MSKSVPKQVAQAVAARRSPPVIAKPAVKPRGAANAVGAIGYGDCRWPFGDPRDEDFHFCCASTGEGAVYCNEHAAVARTVMTRR